MITYSDEITPGNQLAHRNARKSQAIYWSFLELGPYLSGEKCWFTAVVLRSCKCPSLSSLYKNIILSFFNGNDSRDIEKGGFMCSRMANGVPLHLWATYGLSLADEGALHMTFMSMGAGGLKCCVCCQNVFDSSVRPNMHPDQGRPPPLHSLYRAWTPGPKC